jgi:hypothetical protein
MQQLINCWLSCFPAFPTTPVPLETPHSAVVSDAFSLSSPPDICRLQVTLSFISECVSFLIISPVVNYPSSSSPSSLSVQSYQEVSLSRPCYAAAEYHNTVSESLTEFLFYECVKLEYLRVMLILRLNEVIFKYTLIELSAQSNFSHREFIFG